MNKKSKRPAISRKPGLKKTHATRKKQVQSRPSAESASKASSAEIRELKSALATLKRLNHDLEHRGRLRTEELAAAQEELKSFSYSISHDLRAPLRAIGGFARILETKLANNLPPEAQSPLQRIQENATKMGELMDGLLDFSSLNFRPLTRIQLDPADLARRVFEELKPTFAGRRVELHLADLPPCKADPTLLKQVFLNLLSNALKYSRERDPAIIRIGTGEDGGETAYCVEDNGAGFDMEYSGKLFRVFQRLHSVEQFPGTGVGLAIVHRIISRHGGRVWAEGEVDQGARFCFTLGRSTNVT